MPNGVPLPPSATATAPALSPNNAGTAATATKTTLRPPTTFHFLAGLSTGVLSAFLLQPADLLKTRVQQSRSTSLLLTLRSITASPNAIQHLWRGTLPSIIRTGLGSALYFTTLNALRENVARSSLLAPASTVPARTTSKGNGGAPQNIPSPPSSSSSSSSSSSLPRLSNTANLATGAIARASAGFVLMPVTVLKVRYESSLYAYTSLPSAAAHILKQEGARGLFAGFGATAVRDAPYAGLYVVCYERLKPLLGALLYASSEAAKTNNSSNNNDSDTQGSITAGMGIEKAGGMTTPQSAATNFLSGMLAAGIATAATNPFDAVKTRLQLLPGKYANMVQAAKTMLREEGVRSLFDGLTLRMGRKAVSSAVAWTIYEELIRRAEGRWVR